MSEPVDFVCSVCTRTVRSNERHFEGEWRIANGAPGVFCCSWKCLAEYAERGWHDEMTTTAKRIDLEVVGTLRATALPESCNCARVAQTHSFSGECLTLLQNRIKDAFGDGPEPSADGSVVWWFCACGGETSSNSAQCEKCGEPRSALAIGVKP